MDACNSDRLYDMAIGHYSSLLCYYSTIDYRPLDTIDQMDKNKIIMSAILIGLIVLFIYGLITGFGDGQDER